MWKLALLFIYVIVFFGASIGQSQIATQYITHRYSVENHVFLNSNQSSSICASIRLNSSGDDDSSSARAQAQSSQIQLYGSLILGIPSVIALIFLGAVSDKIGRKKCMAITYIGCTMCSIIQTFWVYFDWPMWVFLISNFPMGVSGSFAFLLSSMFSILSDCTTSRQRDTAITFGEVSLGVSVTIFSIVLGFCMDAFGYKFSFYGCMLLILLSGPIIFFIPETSPMLKRNKLLQDGGENSRYKKPTAAYDNLINSDSLDSSASEALSSYSDGLSDSEASTSEMQAFNPLRLMKETFSLITSNRQRGILIGLLMFIFFTLLFMLNGPTIIFLQGQPFCWNAVWIGVYSGGSAIIPLICSLLLIHFTQNYLNSASLIIIGLISQFATQFSTGISVLFPSPFDNYAIYASVVLGIVNSSVSPIVRSELSKLVDRSETGAMFGLVASLEALTIMMGAVALNALYEVTLTFYSGFIFFVASAAMLLLIFITIIYRRRRGRYQSRHYNLLIADALA